MFFMPEGRNFFREHLKKIVGAGLVVAGLGAAMEMQSEHDNAPASNSKEANGGERSKRRLLDSVQFDEKNDSGNVEVNGNVEDDEDTIETDREKLDIAKFETIVTDLFPGIKKYDPAQEHPYDHLIVGDYRYLVVGGVLQVEKVKTIKRDKYGHVVTPSFEQILDIDIEHNFAESGQKVEVSPLEESPEVPRGQPISGDGTATEEIPLLGVDFSGKTDEETKQLVGLVADFSNQYTDIVGTDPDRYGDTTAGHIQALNQLIDRLTALGREQRFAERMGAQGQEMLNRKINDYKSIIAALSAQ
jgi:hypothetical protein